MSKDTLTWFQVNNILPIIISAVMITTSFLLLQQRIALVEQKLDTIVQQQKEILTAYRGLEGRYGELSLKVNTLESISSYRK